MTPSKKDKRKGNASEKATSTSPEPNRPNNLDLGRPVSTPSQKIEFIFSFKNKALTALKYDNLSSFPSSSFYFPDLLHNQGLEVLIFYLDHIILI